MGQRHDVDRARGTDGRQALGRRGETIAAAVLERQGYRVVARNVRAGGVEIDLIVRRGRVLAFVEVKTRQGSGAGAPEEAVDRRKRDRLVRGAAAWLAEHGARGAAPRFDVVSVVVDGAAERVRHWPGAFDAGD